jgi:hypothetical protein
VPPSTGLTQNSDYGVLCCSWSRQSTHIATRPQNRCKVNACEINTE